MRLIKLVTFQLVLLTAFSANAFEEEFQSENEWTEIEAAEIDENGTFERRCEWQLIDQVQSAWKSAGMDLSLCNAFAPWKWVSTVTSTYWHTCRDKERQRHQNYHTCRNRF